jgi:Tol biopolymer transport system component
MRIEVQRSMSDEGEERFALRCIARQTRDGPEQDAVTCVTTTVLAPRGPVLVSRAFDGLPARRHAELPAVSDAGRRVAFSSEADHMDARGDANSQSDVFLVDVPALQTQRISDASNSIQGNADSRYPSMSADGRHVAFQSRASNLVPFDNNEVEDIFVLDTTTDRIVRGSLTAAGAQANGGSENAFIAAGGRHLAFTSYADNLITGDTNAAPDVFIRNLENDAVECVSRAQDGSFGNAGSETIALTADGRFAVFQSYASNLGPRDTNGFADVYLWDRTTRQIELISANTNDVAADGPSGGPSISDDGRWIAFFSHASDLLPGATPGDGRAYLFDRQNRLLTDLTAQIPGLPRGWQTRRAMISPRGAWLALAVTADCGGIPYAPSHVFVFDRLRSTSQAVSVTRTGALAGDHSFIGRFSPDDRFLAFESHAANLRVEPGYPAGQIYLVELTRAGADLLVQRGSGGARRGQGTADVEQQTVALTARAGGEPVPEFFVTLRNEGSTADQWSLHAMGVDTNAVEMVAVVTTGNRNDISAPLLGESGWTTPMVPSGGELPVRLSFRLTAGADSDMTIEIRGASLLDGSRIEAARLILSSTRTQMASRTHGKWSSSPRPPSPRKIPTAMATDLSTARNGRQAPIPATALPYCASRKSR